jgi:hypothetical protein
VMNEECTYRLILGTILPSAIGTAKNHGNPQSW